MTSKKALNEATPDQAQSRRNRGKTVRRSLVEASEAQDAALLARELRTSQTQHELAVIVVVEFTGELRKRKQLTAAARLARAAAAGVAGIGVELFGEAAQKDPMVEAFVVVEVAGEGLLGSLGSMIDVVQGLVGEMDFANIV